MELKERACGRSHYYPTETIRNIMEHRNSARAMANFEVTIYRQGRAVGRGRVKNESRTGFFIETEFSDVENFQLIGLEFEFNNSGMLERYMYEAFVVRKSQAGLGVELHSVNADFFPDKSEFGRA